MESEQPFKQEREARAFCSIIGGDLDNANATALGAYVDIMKDFCKKMGGKNPATHDARQACYDFYFTKAMYAGARHKAINQDWSLDKVKSGYDAIKIKGAMDDAEKELHRLASWSGANLQ